jgi:plasmid stabilization system protein ParE
MPVEVRFHPEAVEEVDEAYRWYRARSPSTAYAFVRALDTAISAISEAPERPALQVDGTRRVLLRRFPYAVIYRPMGHALQVIAVAHGRRRPGYWRGR